MSDIEEILGLIERYGDARAGYPERRTLTSKIGCEMDAGYIFAALRMRLSRITEAREYIRDFVNSMDDADENCTEYTLVPEDQLARLVRHLRDMLNVSGRSWLEDMDRVSLAADVEALSHVCDNCERWLAEHGWRLGSDEDTKLACARSVRDRLATLVGKPCQSDGMDREPTP